MIESLSIRSIGVISSANLELAPGFTALTGETGAGKTTQLPSYLLEEGFGKAGVPTSCISLHLAAYLCTVIQS